MVARAAAALLVLTTVGCADELSTQTVVPASAEPFDLASLNGKAIEIQTMASGNFAVDPPGGKDHFRIVGKTIVWGGEWQASRCVLNGIPFGNRMAILFSPDQPRANVKVPCEGDRHPGFRGDVTLAPGDVTYSSTAVIQGNTVELSGDLHEHEVEVSEERPPLNGTTTWDTTEHLHAKVRLAGDQCQVLDFSWTTNMNWVVDADPRPRLDHRQERAIGCSIVAAPS